MNKAQWLKWVNLALMISASIQIATSLVMYFDIPVWDIQLFFKVHKHNGLIFIVLVMIHVWINFGWIKATFFRKKTKI